MNLKPVEEKKDILIPVDPNYKKTTTDHKFLFMSEQSPIGRKKQIRLKPQKCFARKAKLKAKLNKGNPSMIMGWGILVSFIFLVYL